MFEPEIVNIFFYVPVKAYVFGAHSGRSFEYLQHMRERSGSVVEC